MALTLPQIVASNIRAEMARRGVRQSDLAVALEMSQGSLSKRLAGKARFDLAELQTAADFLGVTVASLLVGDAAVAS